MTDALSQAMDTIVKAAVAAERDRVSAEYQQQLFHLERGLVVQTENAKQLAAALAAERERCAKLCEQIAKHRVDPAAEIWLLLAAEEIRKGE